jgi:phage tail sheath protein FI
MSFIEVTVQQTLQAALFENNDAVLWAQVTVTVSTFLQNLFASGAFAGTDAASSFFVICDSSVNTAATIAAGQLICQVGIAPVTPAEFIIMQMSQWQNGATSSTTVSS